VAVTLREIASRTGLSFQTISHVLNPTSRRRGLYKPETRQMVYKAAREMGYRPNYAARSMATGKLGCVALLLSTEEGHSILPGGLLDGIESALRPADLHLTVSRLTDEKLTDAAFVPKILREWVADGLLINYNAWIPQRMTELIAEYQIPSIWINSKHEHDCVYPDDFDAAYRATQCFIELGHRRIGFADYTTARSAVPGHFSLVDRIGGYRQAMTEAQLSPRLINAETKLGEDAILPFTQHWMLAADAPTAVLAYNPEAAMAIAMVSKLERLTLPSYMSLLTFSDKSPCPFYELSIGTMVLPERELGTVAVDMLIKKIAKPSNLLTPIAVRYGLSQAATVAKPERD